MRAQAERFGAGLLADIRGVLDKGWSHDTEPRRRGISSLRMVAGELEARITLTKGVRLVKGGLVVASVKSMPTTILAAMKGRTVTSVVEPPMAGGHDDPQRADHGQGTVD